MLTQKYKITWKQDGVARRAIYTIAFTRVLIQWLHHTLPVSINIMEFHNVIETHVTVACALNFRLDYSPKRNLAGYSPPLWVID